LEIATFGQKLVEAVEQAVVCDQQGRVLGLFSPVLDRPETADLQLDPPLSIAETEELRKNRTRKPLE
jgi:hypothetical protein